MSDGSVIEGECKKCGAITFTLPDHANDEAWIICDRCGQMMMTWGAYKASAQKRAFDDANTRLISKPFNIRPDL